MITSVSNMTLKPAGRGACKRSRIVILASSETDHLSLGRTTLWGWKGRLSRRFVQFDGLDSSDGPQDVEATATAASADEGLASASALLTSRICPYCSASLDRVRRSGAMLYLESMRSWVLRNTFLMGTVVALLTTACVKSAQVRLDIPVDHSAFEWDDAITIISARSASCIHDSLRAIQPRLRFVSPGDFRRAALPPRASGEVAFAYPMSESQQKLLSSQDFRDRIAPLRLRYLVLVGEKEMVTRREETGGQGGIMSSWWTRLTLTASVI